jgi:hypothetical protein
MVDFAMFADDLQCLYVVYCAPLCTTASCAASLT